MATQRLQGRRALVTGGGRGIGRSIALAYAAEGADVAVVARTSAEVEEAAVAIRALGRAGHALTADLTDPAQVTQMTARAVEALGAIDILVNNAGGYRLHTNAQSRSVSVLDYDLAEWQRIMDVNCTTALLACQAVVPLMIEQGGGVVVNVTSGAATRGRPGWGAYGASKAALNRFSEALAAEVAGSGVAVNLLDPGLVYTRPNEDWTADPRMRLPDDTAESAVFLALQTPASMTGQLVSAPDFDAEHGLVRPPFPERGVLR